MDLVSFSLGVSKFFFEDCFQNRLTVHEHQTHITGVQSSLLEVFEELPPTGGGFLVTAFKHTDCHKPIELRCIWILSMLSPNKHFDVDNFNEEAFYGFLGQITGPSIFNGIAQVLHWTRIFPYWRVRVISRR